MGQLFWKFLFSYWAALLLAMIGVTTAAWLYQLSDHGRDQLLETGPRTTLVIGSAAAILHHGGVGALQAFLEERARHQDAPLFAVNDRGRDLLGRPVAPGALVRARKVAASEEDPEAARQVQVGNGATFTLYIPAAATPWLQRLLFRGGPPPPMVPLAAGLLASLVFGALLAWYVARPIRHLRAAFASLSHGNLETRVAPLMGRRRDDVADLGRDFDRMAQQLQSLMGAQRFLLHEVSHELRSPLARLQAAIGLARQNPDEVDGSFERIEREADCIDELVGQLLTLSRLEATVADPSGDHVECTDLMDLVASIVADAHFEAQANGRAVVFESEGDAVAEVLAELIHRAVENVIRNSVRYTGRGSTVEVRAEVSRSPFPEARGGTFVVRVADRGPGVAESELPSIFEPFFRGAEGQWGAGFGLGLAITRRAIEAHGGSVRADNRAGGGLVIELALPLEVPGRECG